MNFNDHSRLAGSHAFLSASNYHWINYDLDKLTERWKTATAAAKGTELHEFASQAIRLGIKLPKTTKTMNMYVNDAIGYRMTPEQVLFYSVNSFGTADAISFKRNLLRIPDLKTGVTKASMHQLEVYAALFCLEYNFKPFDIDILLRLYQNDEVEEYVPDRGDIAHIMDKIITFDKHIELLRMEES